MSPILRTEERRPAILDQVNDPEDESGHVQDKDPGEQLRTPDLGPNLGENRVLKQEIVWPDTPEESNPEGSNPEGSNPEGKDEEK